MLGPALRNLLACFPWAVVASTQTCLLTVESYIRDMVLTKFMQDDLEAMQLFQLDSHPAIGPSDFQRWWTYWTS